ncbi:MAG: response regulator [Pseudomonadota bacterium]
MKSSNPRVHRLLIVEDSISFSYWIKAKLEGEEGLEFILARSLAEAKQAIEIYKGDFFLALLDLNLPDASDDEVMHLAAEHKIPSVAFTGSCSEELRERLFKLGAIDYVHKDNPHSLNTVISMVHRLRGNTRWKALVVDDSRLQRSQLSALLQKYRFEVIEAENGPEALTLLDATPDIRLVITDFNMPIMDGCELTKAIRKNYAPDRLAIIGISGQTSSPLTARFLKHGANDFLIKPFVREEFFCRVTQNMDYLDHLQALAEAAAQDALTGLHSRRHFFEMAEALAAQARRDGNEFTIASMSIDNFDEITRARGHSVGDEALVHAAKIIRGRFRRGGDVVARSAAGEICLMLHGTEQEQARLMLEELRETLAAAPLATQRGPLDLTMSVGVCAGCEQDVSDMVAIAEHARDLADEHGGDQLVIAEDCGVAYYNDDGYLSTAAR